MHPKQSVRFKQGELTHELVYSYAMQLRQSLDRQAQSTDPDIQSQRMGFTSTLDSNQVSADHSPLENESPL